MRKIKLFLSLLMVMLLSVGNVWAVDYDLVYTLDGSVTSTASGSSAYATAIDIDVNDITWNVMGNTSTNPWGIGGKNLSSTGRPLYSKGAVAGNIVKIEIEHGAASSVTVNSMKVEVATDAAFSDIVSTCNPTFAASSTVTVNHPDGDDAWEDCYYRITYYLTIGGSNKKVEFKSAKFYKEYVAPAIPTCATPTFDPEDGETFTDDIDVEIASATEGVTIYYTTDGNDPTTSSSVYSSALNFTETTTLKAMAVKAGYDNSAVATATYTKVVPFSGSILEIVKGDFTTSSYDDNAGDHEKSGITFTTAKVYQSGGGIQFQKTNGLLYNKTDLGEIAKIEITKVSGKANNLVVYAGTTENPTSGAVTGSTSGSVTTYTFAAGKGFFAIKCNSTGASNVDPIKIYYTSSASSVAKPTITGETPFVTSTTITLACTTEGASVYYTTDGSNPSSGSTLYTEPFVLNAGATVKAIAILGSDQSSIASKEFEKVVSYTTLADIFTKATEVGNTATDIYVTFGGWKVSAKTSNNVFLTDGTNGAVIYGSGHGFNAGDVLTGTVACKVQLYKGFTELTSLNSGSAGLTVTPGSVGDPVTKTWDQLSAVNTGALVTLENLTYDGSSLSDGVNTIPTYTTFYTATFEAGKSYNLTGVYQYYDTDGQILPRSAADVEEIIETFTVTYNNAPENGTLTIKNGDDVVASGSAVNEGTVLDIVTSPAEGYKLKEVQVNGSAYAESTLTLTENVTIAATFEENLAPLVTSYDLSEIGVVTSHLNGERVGDKVNLPLTAASCSKVFRGWDADADCDHAPTYAPGAEITLEANNKFYAVYADANVVAPTDHALGSLTVGGTSGNTASEGYTYTSNKTNDKAGYTQDSGTKDADIIHLQIKAESQIINEEPSAIIVTAHLGAGANRDELTYPVNAVLVDADGNNVGDPVVLTNSIPDKNGDDFSANLPTANYANVRGVKISHMKEDGWNIRYYSMSFKYQTGGTTYDNYSTDCQAQVATPVIAGVSPSGVYTEAKEITITCATDGATIYYAVDSDEEPSTEYTGAFTVDTDGAHTVKAKAVKTDMVASEVASVSFTINLPVVLSTMDQIFAAATAVGSTATDANIQFNNWVVSGVSTNAKNVFVTDGTKGFIIFDNGGNMGFAVGDVLSGTVACKVQLYKGAAELTTLSSTTEGLNIAKEGVITPVVKAISALSGINTGAPVTINSVQFDGTNLSDGVNSIKPFNSLFAYDALENSKYYNVTGIYQQYDATKEILPRSAADIDEVDLDDPELSYSPASVSLEVGQALSAPTFNNPHTVSPINYAVSGDAVATVTNEGVIALVENATGTATITASFAGNAQYAAGNATFTITVSEPVDAKNVVIIAEYDSKFYAMSTTASSDGKALMAIEIEKDGDKIVVASQADKDAIQWKKTVNGDNVTFQDADDKYLKGKGNGAEISLDANVCNWVWDATNNCYIISGSTRSFFYSNSGIFKNYALSNLGGNYSQVAEVIEKDPANIVITSKVDPQLAYSPASVTLTVGGEFTPAALTYAEGFDGLAAVTYASNNESVATVDESGVVSLEENATGTATITATFAGNNNYLAGSASYTITVNEPGDDLSGTWRLANAVVAGQKIIIGSTKDANTYAMGKQNSNNRAAVASTIDGDILTPGAATKVFTLVDAGDGKFAIQASNGKYLTSATSGSSNNLLEAENFDLDNAKWTITIDGEGVASIVAAAGSKTVMQYNSGNTLFSCYGSASQTDVKIYSTTSVVRTDLTEGWYYTMCLDKAVTAVQGGSIWRVLSKAANGNDVILEEVTGTLDAGRPYIFRAAASTLEVAYTGAAVGAPVTEGNNGLVGSFTEEPIAQSPNNYIIYNNALYYVNSDNVKVGAHRAYLDMTGVPAYSNEPQQGAPRRRVTMAVYGEQTATGMDALNAADAPVKMMINGQLFILRGEKMYDATGRLVK